MSSLYGRIYFFMSTLHSFSFAMLGAVFLHRRLFHLIIFSEEFVDFSAQVLGDLLETLHPLEFFK